MAGKISISKACDEFSVGKELIQPGTCLLKITKVEFNSFSGQVVQFKSNYLCVHVSVCNVNGGIESGSFHDLFWLTERAEWRLVSLLRATQCFFSDKDTIFYSGFTGRYLVSDVMVTQRHSSTGNTINVNELGQMRPPRIEVNKPNPLDLSIEPEVINLNQLQESTRIAEEMNDELPF